VTILTHKTVGLLLKCNQRGNWELSLCVTAGGRSGTL
jgi:hypothetical protein